MKLPAQSRVWLSGWGWLLAAAQLGAGILDPTPLGEELCLLAEAFRPVMDTHFVAAVGLSGDRWLLAYRRQGTDRIHSQLFDGDGLPTRPESALDEPFVGPQFFPNDLTTDPASGRVLAVWHGLGSPGGDGSLTSVKARLIDPTGTPVGDSFQVNSTEQGVQSRARATFLAGGGFVVTFEDDPVSPSVFRIRARVFDSQGTPLGDDFLVTPDGVEGMFEDVAASPAGRFFVVATAFDAQLEPLGLLLSEHQPDGSRARQSLLPIEGLADTFALTAELDTEDALRIAVSAYAGEGSVLRLFRVDVGEPDLGPRTFSELEISRLGYQASPDLLTTAKGGLGLVWLNNPENTGGEGTNSVLSLSADDEPVSAIVDLNGTDPLRAAGSSDSALLGEGKAIAVWGNNAIPGSCDVLARFFYLPEPLFTDGFESGDSSAWGTTTNP